VAPDEQKLREWVATARAAWPGIDVPDRVFEAHLARHASDDAAQNVGDLYLACACAAGDPKAIAELETRFIADLGKAIWQVRPGDRDDVLQRVREQLLVGSDGEPLIARYAGRGSLRGWLRSVVMRTALKHARGKQRAVPFDEHDFLELAASSDDPALAPYKERYREAFRAAFRTALAALEVRQRNILRQYFLDQMTIDELATLYRVHRATAARWIHDIRADLVGHVRRALEANLPASEVGLRTLIDLVASQLDLSLERLI
jgi:RNA polymerase sigma-70 factor (ECF subfamily)